MKRFLLSACLGMFLLSCNDSKDKTPAAGGGDSSGTAMDKPVMDLPYTASFSSSFTTDVSDADLKMVLQSYKDWADGNLTGLANEMGDTITVDMSNGAHLVKSNADLMKMWGTYRDSLSKVDIDMQAWQKMYATNKKEAYVVVWYKETDWYKSGKADSAYFHDINGVKNGKITGYEQYRRPAAGPK